jgi:hypothetical protein
MELAGASNSERRKVKSGTKGVAQKVHQRREWSESRDQEEQRMVGLKEARAKTKKGEQGPKMGKRWVQDDAMIQ